MTPSSEEHEHDPVPASEETSMFRSEALRHRARMRGPGEVVRIAPTWTSWAFYALLGLVAATLVAGSLIEIDRYATGITATDHEGRLIVLVPATVASQVAPGRPVELGRTTAEVVSSDGAVLSPSEVKERYGVDVAVSSVALMTSGTEAGAALGPARVLVGSEPVILALIPGLDALLGGDDA